MKKPHRSLITLNCNEVTCGRCQLLTYTGWCHAYKDYIKRNKKGQFERLSECHFDEFAAELMTAAAAVKTAKPSPVEKAASHVAASIRKNTERPCPKDSRPARTAKTTTPSKRSRSTTPRRTT